MMEPEVNEILTTVAAVVGGITPADLMGRRRTEPLAPARQLAMWLLRQAHGWTYDRIGRSIGGRGRDTALRAVKATADRLEVDHQWLALARRIAVQLQILPEIKWP